jgi:hypothetical protein
MSIWEHIFIECNVTGNKDASGGEIKKTVSFVMRGIAKKDAATGTRR